MQLGMYKCQDELLRFKVSIRMWKKRDLSDFKHGMFVGAR